MMLLQLTVQSWFVMIPLWLCTVLAVAIILERMYYFISLKGDTDALTEQIYLFVDGRQLVEAEAFCRHGQHPVLRVALAALEHRQKSALEMTGFMQRAAHRESQGLLRFDTVLATLIRISMPLGLFGTVVGMIRSFMAIGQSGQAVSQADLARYMSEALIATGFGLIIAISALFFSGIFYERSSKCITAMEQLVNILPGRLAAGGK